MKPSEEQRLGNVINAALERVRQYVCRNGSAAQWHITKAAGVVRKPSLLERIAPHLEGDAAQAYLSSLPAWIEETKKQDTICGLLWEQRRAGSNAPSFNTERDRLVALLLRFDFGLKSYEKLARQPDKMLAELAVSPESAASTGTQDTHDEATTRMAEKEYTDLERQIELELQSVDKARAELVAGHETLVAKYAEKSGEPIEEATTYARSGLAKAAENFDVRRGFRFATYAQWWIKTAIKEKKSWDA